MKLETILQILYANKMDNVISLAVQIDNAIPFELNVGDEIGVEMSRSELPAGKKFTGNNRSWGTIPLRIQAVNRYSMDAPYLVHLPNGKTKWVGNKSLPSDPVEIIDEEPVAATVMP